jgi:mannose-6-phosphate isomerase
MYLGLNRDVALSCFDLQKAGDAVLTQGKKRPLIISESVNFRKEILISLDDTPCFAVNRYTVFGTCELEKLAVYVVTRGEGELTSPSGRRSVRKGSYFFVPYAASEVSVRTEREIELVECLPPSRARAEVARFALGASRLRPT